MTTAPTFARREFLAGALALGVASGVVGVDAAPALLGPILGPVDETTAMVWLRAAAGEYSLEITPAAGGAPLVLAKTASENGNDASGLAPGKENTRRVFTRYRPQKIYGDGTGGIYTSFRRGPLEVFLLDTRWFAMTEPSFAEPHKPTLLGTKQWEWLQQGLLASTAPFKMLACGVIWDDKENAESDDWGIYRHELTAIQKFIGEKKISGVILMGGDIHASRVLRYPTKKSVGYDLVQFIASPVHGSTIPSLNVYNPNLVRSAVEPHVFLRIDADSTVTPAEFHASLINKNGETVFSYHLTADDLRPQP